jgi:hypothetical protein
MVLSILTYIFINMNKSLYIVYKLHDKVYDDVLSLNMYIIPCLFSYKNKNWRCRKSKPIYEKKKKAAILKSQIFLD